MSVTKKITVLCVEIQMHPYMLNSLIASLHNTKLHLFRQMKGDP